MAEEASEFKNAPRKRIDCL